MTTIGHIFAALAVIACEVALVLSYRQAAYRRGMEKGFEEGYAQGRNDELSWWMGVKQAAEGERREMWKREDAA